MGNAASNNGSMAVEKKIKVKKLVNRDATTQDKSTKKQDLNLLLPDSDLLNHL